MLICPHASVTLRSLFRYLHFPVWIDDATGSHLPRLPCPDSHRSREQINCGRPAKFFHLEEQPTCSTANTSVSELGVNMSRSILLTRFQETISFEDTVLFADNLTDDPDVKCC